MAIRHQALKRTARVAQQVLQGVLLAVRAPLRGGHGRRTRRRHALAIPEQEAVDLQEEVLRDDGLEQVIRSAQLHRAAHERIVVEAADHDDLALVVYLAEPLQHVQTRQHRHLDVGEDERHALRAGELHRALAVLRLMQRKRAGIARFEHGSDRCADGGFVVHDQDRNHAGSPFPGALMGVSLRGTRTVMTVPSPRMERMDSP